MKFKAKTKDCQLIVKVKTSFGEVIDEKELDRFSRVFLRGFLKPKLIKRNQIEYSSQRNQGAVEGRQDRASPKNLLLGGK